MNDWYRHRSNPAKSGPPRRPVPGRGAAPSAALADLAGGPRHAVHSQPVRPGTISGGAPRPRVDTFAAFVNQVDANQIRTATINPEGKVEGQLTTGGVYVSQLPIAIPDDQFVTQLQDHDVQVTGTTAGGTSVAEVIFNLAPCCSSWASSSGSEPAAGL
jgi:cell division protease FtsH